MTDASAPHFHEHEDAVDGCISDIKIREDDAISNIELPPATGGVHSVVEGQDDQDSIDGCDIDFNVNDVTRDAELPAAAGGMVEIIDWRRA